MQLTLSTKSSTWIQKSRWLVPQPPGSWANTVTQNRCKHPVGPLALPRDTVLWLSLLIREGFGQELWKTAREGWATKSVQEDGSPLPSPHIPTKSNGPLCFEAEAEHQLLNLGCVFCFPQERSEISSSLKLRDATWPSQCHAHFQTKEINCCAFQRSSFTPDQRSAADQPPAWWWTQYWGDVNLSHERRWARQRILLWRNFSPKL